MQAIIHMHTNLAINVGALSAFVKLRGNSILIRSLSFHVFLCLKRNAPIEKNYVLTSASQF